MTPGEKTTAGHHGLRKHGHGGAADPAAHLDIVGESGNEREKERRKERRNPLTLV